MKKKLIIVLGMHRSGTSVVARSLQVMGVNLGDRLIPPLEGENDKGFWEDLDLNSLNVEMLNAINSDWHFLTPIQPVDVDTLRRGGYLLRAVELLRKKISNFQIFGFKDPRVAKLLPFWKEAFAESGLDVGYVLAIRHPISVSKSLMKRNGFDVEKSYFLWLEHVLGSLTGTVGEKRVLVDYDLLMQYPMLGLTRIAEILQLKIDPTELRIFETEFLDQNLRHTVYQVNDLALDDTVLSLTREVYAELLDLATEGQRLESRAFNDKIERWNNEFLRFKPALILVDKLMLKTNLTNQFVVEKEQTVQMLISQVAEKEQAVQMLISQVAEKEQTVQMLISQVAEKEQTVQMLISQVAEKEQTVQMLVSQVAEKEQAAQTLAAQLENVYKSLSWRITAPLRVKSKLRI
jgi:hypothetical protein